MVGKKLPLPLGRPWLAVCRVCLSTIYLTKEQTATVLYCSRLLPSHQTKRPIKMNEWGCAGSSRPGREVPKIRDQMQTAPRLGSYPSTSLGGANQGLSATFGWAMGGRVVSVAAVWDGILGAVLLPGRFCGWLCRETRALAMCWRAGKNRKTPCKAFRLSSLWSGRRQRNSSRLSLHHHFSIFKPSLVLGSIGSPDTLPQYRDHTPLRNRFNYHTHIYTHKTAFDFFA